MPLLVSMLLVGSWARVWHTESALAVDGLLPASQMFSAETQAMLVMPDSERFLAKWSETQLGKLAADQKLKQFWETQRQEIQGRFREAGWQLSMEIEDLSDIAGGQTAIAWIARPKNESKPFSVAMVVDVAGRVAPTENFLKRIDKQLKEKGATSKSMDIGNVKVTQYSSPRAPGEPRSKESYYALSLDQLLAADDMDSMKELIESQKGDKSDSLAKSDIFQTVQSKIRGDGDEPELEYFVRPIGFAKLLRSISSKPSNNQADILKILDTQGFGDLKCFAGNIQISADGFDFFHNGYVLAKKPLSTTVQILDFPNVKSLQPPEWISKDSASVTSFSWSLANAFPKFKGLVDAYVGAGTFDTVMEGIRDDINGPQIDIVKDVLPYITTEFHIITEILKPIGPESKRSMVVVKLQDPGKKLAKVVERFGKSEPDAKPIDVDGYRVWRMKTEREEEVKLDFNVGTDGKDTKSDEDQDEPLLDQWAMCIMDDYFVFSSNAETIIDTIKRVKAKSGSGDFAKEPDVIRLSEAIKNVSAEGTICGAGMTRSDRAFEMQYELFRNGKLPDTKSMLATIMDRILKPKNPRQGQPQKLDGGALPPFDKIKEFLNPTGGVVQSESDGWSTQSFILSK
jgi:hypothetical protein